MCKCVYVYICSFSGLDGKESACSAGDLGSTRGSGRYPWKWQPTVVLPGESHGQRNLAGCSPWNCKELDYTEQLNTLTSVCLCIYIYTHAYKSIYLCSRV